MAEQQDAVQVRSVVDRLVGQVVRASEVPRMAEKQDAMQVRSVVERLVDQVVRASRMAEKQDAMQVRPAVVTVMKELLDKVVRENTVLLPAEGTSIEVQWTVD
jgi:hypothetical protein